MFKYVLIALLFAAPVQASHSKMIVIRYETHNMATYHHRDKTISQFQKDSIQIIGGVVLVRAEPYSVVVIKGKKFSWEEINPRIIEIMNFACENCRDKSKIN